MKNKTSNLEQKTGKGGFLNGFRSLVISGLIAAGSVGLGGCVTTPMYYARSIDRAVPRDSFGYEEAIKLQLNNYSGRTATYFIQSMSTGDVVKRNTFHIPRDWSGVEWTVGNLPSGSYYTHVEVEGKTVGTWKFSVR